MSAGPSIAHVAALTGNPARANILVALLDGRALPASQLAVAAGVSPQTTSGYLADLTCARLLERRADGRQVFYRLASPLVGRMLEALMAVAGDSPLSPRGPPKATQALRSARTCYDHLAGRLGVALTEALVARRQVVLGEDGGRITAKGAEFFDRFGIELSALGGQRRAFCRPCLDWSERRIHLAGALGAAIAARAFDLGWIERQPQTRAVAITPAGHAGFDTLFALKVGDL